MTAPLSIRVTEQAKHLLTSGQTQKDTAIQLDISSRSVHVIAKKAKDEIRDLALGMVQDNLHSIRYNTKTVFTLSSQILSYIKGIHSSKEYHAFKGLSHRLKVLKIDAKDILNIADRKEARMLELMGITKPYASGGDTFIDKLLILQGEGKFDVPRIVELLQARSEADLAIEGEVITHPPEEGQ